MTTTFKLAWRNMWRNWRRTTIALVAIVLAVGLMLFADGMIRGSDQAIFGNAVRLYGGNLQIHAPGFRAKAERMPLLPLENADYVVQALKSQPEVAAASQRIITGGVVSHRGTNIPVSITAIQPSVEQPFSLQAQHVTTGRFLQDSDGDGIVIGKGMADRLAIGVGDSVSVLGRSKDLSMRRHTMSVVGIFDLGMPDVEEGMLFMPLSDAQTLYNLRGQATEVAVFLQAVGGEDTLMSNLQTRLPGYEVDTWQTLRPEIRQTLNTKLAFSSFIGMVILIIAAIGLLNLMLMAAFERTREMGVLAALGMKRRQIMGLFLVEGALIGLVGALIGGGLGLLLVGLVGQVGIDLSTFSGFGEIMALLGNRLYPSIAVGDLVSRGVLVVGITAIASSFPAWQAARKEPAVALHHI